MNLRRYSSQADGEVGGTKKDFLADWWVKREMKSQQNSSNNRRHLLITWSILLPDLVHQAPCTAEVSFDKEFQVKGRNLYNWGHITIISTKQIPFKSYPKFLEVGTIYSKHLWNLILYEYKIKYCLPTSFIFIAWNIWFSLLLFDTRQINLRLQLLFWRKTYYT